MSENSNDSEDVSKLAPDSRTFQRLAIRWKKRLSSNQLDVHQSGRPPPMLRMQ